MKLVSLLNFYKYTFDAVDIYDYRTDQYLYTKQIMELDKNIYVRQFAVYEAEDKTILEIWV